MKECYPIDYRDMHKGERVFILGNGQSLSRWRDKELPGRTIGINKSWFMGPVGPSDHHCFVTGVHLDDLLAGEYRAKIAVWTYSTLQRTPTRSKFGQYEGDTVFVKHTGGERKDLFRFDLHHGTGTMLAGLFALQVACYMGFAEIFLLGYDSGMGGHHYKEDTVRRCYEDWFVGAGIWIKPRNDVHIYNCNPDSMIRQFEFAEVPAA